MEIHQPLHHIGEITGEITTDEIPSGMYRTFCIGK
jgi:tRNA U34 5-carboxymethylaminomethyl modifying GTPase MnmE/TrmE